MAIKINVGEEIPPFIPNDTEFVNKEFLKSFASKEVFTSAPTHTPTNFYDQIVFAHIGADYKLYIYVDGVWKSTALT